MSNDTTPLAGLDAALDASAYHWLERESPGIARAIRAGVRAGATPLDVRLHVMRKTSNGVMAAKCEQAAAYILWEIGEGSE